jgi:hypothetical protein
MNTRPHCKTLPAIGIGGQPIPGGITTNSRNGSAASPPSAGFRIPGANCWISPGATMPEPIGSTAEPASDDRRTARMDRLGHHRAACAYDAAADHQALAIGSPSFCRSSSRRLVMRQRRQWLGLSLRSNFRQNALQHLNARRERTGRRLSSRTADARARQFHRRLVKLHAP